MNPPKSKPGYKWEKTIYQQYEEIPKDWDFVSISETGKIIGGGTPDTNNLEYWENGDIPWFTPKELTKIESNFVKDSKRKITQKGLDECGTNLIPENNILITTRATIGNCVINEKKAATNQGFQNLIINKNHNNKFLMYSLRFNKRRLRQYSQGTTFLEISGINFGRIKIPCPKDIREEAKIGSILYNIDELFQKQKQVIKQTQKLKKEQIQKLFSQGLDHDKPKEIQIKPRFIKYKIPTKWNVSDLKSVSKKIVDIDHKMPNKTNFGVKFIAANNLNDDEIDFKNAELISESDYLAQSKKFNAEKNDILISRIGSIGVARKIRTNERFIASYSVALIKPKESIDSEFLHYYLNSTLPQKVIKAYTIVSGNINLVLGALEKVPVLLPPTIEEQKRIGLILRNLDLLIQQEKQYKEKLEKIKRGLMQQLLTGKTRVKI